MKQRINLSPDQRDRLYEEVLPAVVTDAHSSATGFMTDSQMEVMDREMSRVRGNRVATALRTIYGSHNQPSQHPIFVTTFSEIVGSGDNLDAALKMIQGTPKFRTPALVQLGHQVGEVVRRYGEDKNNRLLRAWRLGTMTVLDYVGKRGELKSLPPHKDSGRTPSVVRFAIGMGEGSTTIEDDLYLTNTGDLSAFSGADLSRQSGVPQKTHAVEALGPKKSLIIDSQIVPISEY